jgi:cell division protein FtsB
LQSGSSLLYSSATRGSSGALQDEISALEQTRDDAAAYNDDLRNDPWTVEKLAREEYGMIKEGETCYRVVLEDEEKK